MKKIIICLLCCLCGCNKTDYELYNSIRAEMQVLDDVKLIEGDNLSSLKVKEHYHEGVYPTKDNMIDEYKTNGLSIDKLCPNMTKDISVKSVQYVHAMNFGNLDTTYYVIELIDNEQHYCGCYNNNVKDSFELLFRDKVPEITGQPKVLDMTFDRDHNLTCIVSDTTLKGMFEQLLTYSYLITKGM